MSEIEWVEVATLDDDIISSAYWTLIRLKFCHLPIQRDGKWNRLLCDIRLRGITSNISAAVELSADTLGTKVANCVIAEVKEVFTPDLHPGVAVLRAPSWFYRMNLGHIVEAERDR